MIGAWWDQYAEGGQKLLIDDHWGQSILLKFAGGLCAEALVALVCGTEQAWQLTAILRLKVVCMLWTRKRVRVCSSAMEILGATPGGVVGRAD